jgi:hypothetical protein
MAAGKEIFTSLSEMGQQVDGIVKAADAMIFSVVGL